MERNDRERNEMDLRCPFDHVAFVTLAIYETEISYCPKCGLWIDPDEIRLGDRLARFLR
jgi:Zn-finger nucleic acid-binding protein